MNEYGLVEENVDLKKLNTYGIGGKARFLIHPVYEKVLPLLNYLEDKNIPWYVLGGGTNVILPDEDFKGAIIKLDKCCSFNINHDLCEVQAGISLSKLINELVKVGYVNLAPLFGIPGLLGSAIAGNVGANGKEIFDYVKSVTYIDEDKQIKTKLKEEIDYSYRYTEFKNKKVIILKVTLALVKGNIEEAKLLIKTNFAKRKLTQPIDTKNAGSVFLNPPGNFAGKLIEEANLKGTHINDALISPKHANFIVNQNKAQSKDIIDLINLIKKEIKNKYNIDLKLEQIIVKWDEDGTSKSKKEA